MKATIFGEENEGVPQNLALLTFKKTGLVIETIVHVSDFFSFNLVVLWIQVTTKTHDWRQISPSNLNLGAKEAISVGGGSWRVWTGVDQVLWRRRPSAYVEGRAGFGPGLIRCCGERMGLLKLGFRKKGGSEERVKDGSERKGGGGELGRMMSLECFRIGKSDERKVEVEENGEGEEIWDSEEAEKAKHLPEHLVVMVNGLTGSAQDWKYAAKKFVQKLPDKVIVHRSECNSSRLTFDGVDLMGERLAEEVLSVVRRRPGVQKISFVAHSLGGLIARYAIGRLYEPPAGVKSSVLVGSSEVPIQRQEQAHEGRIAGLEPLNFITFATPHLGSRGNKQLPILCGLPFLERSASQTAHWIVGRTGKHLFLTDNDDGKPPLLLRMTNDCDDLKFMSALCSFRRCVAYANANFDHMVGWRTSSIRRQHELPQSNQLVKYEKYPHIIHIEREATNSIHQEVSKQIKVQTIDMEEEMIRGLTQVSWERVDVSFRKSRQRYIAHNTIQVNSYWMNSDGADVVFHMIDNFLL